MEGWFEWRVRERRSRKGVSVLPTVTPYGPYAGTYGSYAQVGVTK
jgi:hypothetical protein